MIPRIRDLLEDLYAAEPPLWAVDSVAEIAGSAEVWLRSRYSDLSEEAIGALANQFAFDWKSTPERIAACPCVLAPWGCGSIRVVDGAD